MSDKTEAQYKKELAELDKEFESAVPDRGGFTTLPKARYHTKIVGVKYFENSTLAYHLGKKQIKVKCEVTMGDYKGKTCNFDLLIGKPEETKGEMTFKSGTAIYKAVLEDLGIRHAGFTEEGLTTVFKKMMDHLVDVYVNVSGFGAYNGPTDAAKTESAGSSANIDI